MQTILVLLFWPIQWVPFVKVTVPRNLHIAQVFTATDLSQAVNRYVITLRYIALTCNLVAIRHKLFRAGISDQG